MRHGADDLHVTYPEPPPDLHVRGLNPTIRPVVTDLKVGQPSEPMQNDAGVSLLMLCERQDPAVQMPSREDIAENLTRHRIDLIARRYLSDLRPQPFTHVRG